VRASVVRLVLVATVGVSLGGIAVARAETSPAGTIRGSVHNQAGDPIPGICVEAISSAAPVQTSTAADGSYSLNVSPRDYLVEFTDCSGTDYIKQYWSQSGSEQADYVRVTDGSDVANVNVAMRPGGRVEGVVTNTDGEPIERAQVIAFARDHGDSAGSAYTEADGTYVLHGLPPGDNQVQFVGMTATTEGYAGQYYGDVQLQSESPFVSVTVGQSASGINAVLKHYAWITGRIQNQSGQVASSACVLAFYPGSGGTYNSSYWTRTGNGDYRIAVAPGDDVRLRFDNCGDTLPAQWYDNAPDYTHAKRVHIDEGATLSDADGWIFEDLPPTDGNVHMSGTVRDADGNPVPGIWVSAVRQGEWQGGETDANGKYEVDHLVAGMYDSYYRPAWETQNFLTTSSKIDLSAGSADNVDVTLQTGGRILGTVSDPHGQPLQGICVRSTNVTGVNEPRQAVTDPDGRYMLVGMDTGSVQLRFLDCHGGNWAGAFWHNEPDDAAHADVVQVTAGSDTTGVDQTMQPGGIITGTVTDADGHRLNGMCVLVVWPDGSGVQAATGVDGTYRAMGLATRSDYVVEASDCAGGAGKYVPAWASPGGVDRKTKVAVTAGHTVTGIDAVLHRAGSFSGSVVDQNGVRVPNVCVNALDANGNEVGGARTDISGTFKATAIPTGTYRVRFRDCGADLRDFDTYYPTGSTEPLTAVPIVVVAGQDTGNVNTSVRRTSPPGPPLHPYAVGGDGLATLTWTPPTDDGGSAVVRYDVVDTDTQQVAASVTGTVHSVVIHGLINGRSYRFVVEAVNAQGVGVASSTVDVTPQVTTHVALSQPSLAARRGQVLSVTARVVDGSGHGLPGAVIQIAAAGSPAILGQLTTNDAGTCAVRFRAYVGGTFVARYVGDAGHRAAAVTLRLVVR
jgi:protocatechuate 3,4-dioxygenase beta subunit